jgi:GNAT superfamily N-acetyltransferase
MIIRDATINDAQRVADIYLLARHTYLHYAPLAHSDQSVRQWISATLIPTGGVFVVEMDSRIVGFQALSDDGTYSWIDHIYLDPCATGLGLGGRLVEQAKQVLRSPIRLYTFQRNEGARRFYQRHGFGEILTSDGSSNEEKTPDVLMEWRKN